MPNYSLDICEMKDGVLQPVLEVRFDGSNVVMKGDEGVRAELEGGIPDSFGGRLMPEDGLVFMHALPHYFPGPYRVATSVREI